MSNFKSGDLVENIHTGEIEMVVNTDYIDISGTIQVIHSTMLNFIYVKPVIAGHYRLISPKKVKINLDKK